MLAGLRVVQHDVVPARVHAGRLIDEVHQPRHIALRAHLLVRSVSKQPRRSTHLQTVLLPRPLNRLSHKLTLRARTFRPKMCRCVSTAASPMAQHHQAKKSSFSRKKLLNRTRPRHKSCVSREDSCSGRGRMQGNSCTTNLRFIAAASVLPATFIPLACEFDGRWGDVRGNGLLQDPLALRRRVHRRAYFSELFYGIII